MGKRTRDTNMERSLPRESKRSSRIAEKQVYIFKIHLQEGKEVISLISKLAHQAKNPAPEGTESIYVDHDEIEWKR